MIVNQLIAGTKAAAPDRERSGSALSGVGGNVPTAVVTALISAQKANIALDFRMAAAIDLAGRNGRSGPDVGQSG